MSAEFNIGDFVVYDVYGICKILRTENISFSKGTPKTAYYVLSPVNAPSSTYYIPLSGEIAAQKLRPPMTEKEIQALLLESRKFSPDWIEKRQERHDYANRILSAGITPELISLIGCLYNRNQQLEAQGKKLNSTDNNIFLSAEKMVREEFSFCLDIAPEDVSRYIHDFMKEAL